MSSSDPSSSAQPPAGTPTSSDPSGAARFTIRPQRADDLPAIEALLDAAFGPGRLAKASYRLREGRAEAPGLSRVAVAGGEEIVGSIRYWPVVARSGTGAAVPLLLLGPLVVRPDLQGKGVGLALMRETLAEAAAQGHRLVVLVGDLPYYARVGFSRVPPGRLRMPQPCDPQRLLWCELVPGASQGVSGTLMPASDTAPDQGAAR